MPSHLPGGRRVFSGRRFSVERVEVAGADGQAHGREIVVHPGAVVVLPLLEGGRIVMIRNFRVAVGETLWELPAGTLEPPEPPEACAARELAEEAGYRAASIDPLLTFFTCPGICTERMHAFVARGLTQVGQALEATEQIETHVVTASEAVAMVRDNRIRDGKTIATLLHWWSFARA